MTLSSEANEVPPAPAVCRRHGHAFIGGKCAMLAAADAYRTAHPLAEMRRAEMQEVGNV